MEHGVGGQPHKTPHFNSRHQYTPSGMTLRRRAWVQFNRLRTGVGRFCSCLYKWVWPPLRPLSVAQNKPSTVSSSTVQSIDPPTDYTA